MLSRHKIKKAIYVIFFSLIMFSCNESMERMIQDEYPNEEKIIKSGKVLLVLIDGASGKAVNEAYISHRAPSIRSMRDNGVITFDGLADSRYDNLPVFTNERGWANLMTGMTSHGVGIEEGPGSVPSPIESLMKPDFLQLTKQTAPNKTISLYSSDNNFYNVFGEHVDMKLQSDTDLETKNAVIEELDSNNESPSDIVLVHFNSVEKSGQEYGFVDDANKPTEEVLTSIETIDNYIGELHSVLESRENYKAENWLIIVTTTYGGYYSEISPPDTYYDDPRLNTFSLIYNYQVTGEVLNKPGDNELNYNYVTPIYNGALTDAYARVKDPELFEFPIDQSFTVQFMYYSITGREHWSNVLSKTDRWRGGKGWQVQGDRDRLLFIVNGKWVWSSQRGSGDPNPDPYVNRDGIWHTITMVFDRENNRFKAYVDGTYSTHRDQAEWNFQSDLSCADFALSIGRIAQSPNEDWADFCVSNVQIYDVALPEDFIKINHGVANLEEVQNEYWDNLVGYWPCDREDDGHNLTLKDYSQYAAERNGSSDMILAHERSWASGSTTEPNLRPLPDQSYYTAVINNVDIPFQVMQWLGIPATRFGFEGIGRSLKYTFMDND